MTYFKLEYYKLFFKRALAGLLEIIEHLIIIVKLSFLHDMSCSLLLLLLFY